MVGTSASEDDDDTEDLLDPATALDCPPGSFDEVTERWEEIQQLFESQVSFEEFVSADDFTPVCEVQSVDEIIALFSQEAEENPLESDEADDDDEDEPPPPVSRSEGMHCLDTFRRFAGQFQSDGEVFVLINKIENLTIAAATKNLQQSTIRDYFRPE